jgi:cytochrome P450
VWVHLGDSVSKYNQDVFAPERWLAGTGGAPADASVASGSAAGAAPACPAHGSGSGSTAGPEFSIPFGSGVRGCLGRSLVLASLQVFVAGLARGYEAAALRSDEEWRVVPAPAPREGLMVRLAPLA